MKAQDIKKSLDQYASFGITSMIVTKTDETESIGNILSLCKEQHLPLLFLTDGQKVPKDIHKASASSLLAMLKGFSLDFSNLWSNQLEVEDFPNVWGDNVTEPTDPLEALEPEVTV
jgi:flagellar biosynthesis protein FlhF